MKILAGGAIDDGVKRKQAGKMSFMSKAINVYMQILLLGLAAYIIHRTEKAAGRVLFTLHPACLSIGVSQRK
jgi:hypothetical protein